MPTDRRVVKGRARAIGGALACMIFASNSATAADFFSGKTVRVVVGDGPASAYALYGQLAAYHLGRFIPGNPKLVVSYMPGANGLSAANYLYEIAPRDGTVIFVPPQGIALQQMLSPNSVRYYAAKFSYIGRA